jgi:hypothetical protein
VGDGDINAELRDQLAIALGGQCSVSSGPVMADLMWDRGITASDYRTAGTSVRIDTPASPRLVVLMVVRDELRFYATTDRHRQVPHVIADQGVLLSFDAALQLCREFIVDGLPVEQLTTPLGSAREAPEPEPAPPATKRYACPCCRFLTLDEEPPGTLAICPVCSWQDCPVQAAKPTYEYGLNDVSLDQARRYFATLGASSPQFVSGVRPPNLDELPRTVELDPDEMLVLYAWITRLDERGALLVDDPAEYAVLSRVHEQVGRVMTAQFLPDFHEAVARAWARIRNRSGE